MDAAVRRAEADHCVRAIVITGTGGVAFSAGADLAAVAGGRGHELVRPTTGLAGIVRARTTKPLIAAVDGFALGAGFEIVLACDLVVASTAASFALPEVSMGLAATSGGAFRLAQMIPRARAIELVLTGDQLGAHEANELGLVNRLVAPGNALDEAVGLGRRIASYPALGVREGLALARAAGTRSDDQLWALSDRATDRILADAGALDGAGEGLACRSSRPGDESASGPEDSDADRGRDARAMLPWGAPQQR
jgi:enoyl-CoA hydratase/carnithine racemase